MKHDPEVICKLFGTRLPIVQAGMVWVSGAKLAAASANAGALGVIGAGSMQPDVLQQQIGKAQKLTQHPLAINLPLLYSKAEEQMQVALDAGIKIFFTSAGSPKKYTPHLKGAGCTVVHVTSSPELALKCEAAGVDAVVAEGFEAGGHNGRDEITTMALIPQVVDRLKIPVIAAGGIGDGRAIAAAFALGAAGVQIGTRFAMTKESSAHANFKKAILEAGPGDTLLTMKDLVPVRLLKNPFFEAIQAAQARGASKEELAAVLGKGRAKRGMHEGDLIEGELEIGQVAALMRDIPSVAELVQRLCAEYAETTQALPRVLA